MKRQGRRGTPAGLSAAAPVDVAGAARDGLAGESLAGVTDGAPASVAGVAPAELAAVRRALLAARESRQARLDACIARTGGTGCVIAVSTAIPGIDKRPDGVERLLDAAADMLRGAGAVQVGLHPAAMDPLGSFLLFTGPADARRMKEACVALESAAPWGRLLDLDVYGADGRPVTRRSLGLPERRCLVCDEAARDCARLGRHRDAELRNRVGGLLTQLRTVHEPGRDPQHAAE